MAISNKEHYRYLKKLSLDGLELHGRLETDADNIPIFTIMSDDKIEHPVWFLSPFVQSCFNYLSIGDNRSFPKIPNIQELPFRVEDDFIHRHVKREMERGEGKYIYEEETHNGIEGIRFIGIYPYGTIDYGFHAGTWEEFTQRLEGVEPLVYVGYDENDIPDLHYNSLTVEHKELAEDAHLDSVFTDGLIPSNTIIDKTICGCGATWLEIHAKRNSIIIEPNVPVIVGKVQKHPDLIGVYGEDIEVRDIMQRIDEQKGYVKIMTTPDSYPKVERALSLSKIAYRTDYFMLFDECEKIVSESDFRPNIVLPIDDFFAFRDPAKGGKGKAMVSATPIVMSDPRFEQQGFKIIKIKPKINHRQRLELRPTNNVNITVKRTVETIDKDATVCIFHNSVEGIEDLIAFLELPHDQTNIYCSTEARKKLRKRDYRNVFDMVTDENGKTNLNKYNLFTSRFYSAVDIEVDCRPIVIMVTQVHRAVRKSAYHHRPFVTPRRDQIMHTPHTLIDPETEAIQIAGRFRNGIDRLIHVTNTSYELDYQDYKNLGRILKEQHSGLLKLVALDESLELFGEKLIVRDAILNTEYYKEGYLSWETLEINYFRHNNAFLDERLKMLYNFPASLYKAYKRSGAFEVVSQSEYVIYSDEEKQRLENASKAEIAKLLNDIMKRDVDADNPYDGELRQGLIRDFPLFTEALDVLGYARMKALRFRDNAISAELERVKSEGIAKADEVRQAVYQSFGENTWYPSSYVNENIRRIFTDSGIECGRIGLGKHLALYFRVQELRKRDERGWMVHEKRTD